MNALPQALWLALGCLTVSGLAFAEDLSSRVRAASLAGLSDYHGHPFPEVVEPPPPPTTVAPETDAIELAPVKVDTTRLPLSRLFVEPKTRNIVERFLPGTGVTVTETKNGGVKTVGRLFYVPVFWNLRW